MRGGVEGRVISSLAQKIAARSSGIRLYGIAPPKRTATPDQIDEIAARQVERLQAIGVDGLIVYDIQDESERVAAPRPFPFLPTIEPEIYAERHLRGLAVPKVVYRSVSADTPASFVRWLESADASAEPRFSVLVGAPHRRAAVGLALSDAYELARRLAPRIVLGGIAIAERHARSFDEHDRILAKTAHGCRFFVTQAVYDVTSTKSLLSDYSLAIQAGRGEGTPMPIILTFAPCGSEKTLAFMKWLGIAFPRWLENELRHARDPLATSIALCEAIFSEAWDYAREKQIPLGVNVESVSIRKTEIEASVELARRLRRRIDGTLTLVSTFPP